MTENKLLLFDGNIVQAGEVKKELLVEAENKKHCISRCLEISTPLAEEKKEVSSSQTSISNGPPLQQSTMDKLIAWTVKKYSAATKLPLDISHWAAVTFQTDRHKSQLWTVFQAARQLNDRKLARIIDRWVDELHGNFNYSSFLYEQAAKVKVAVHFRTNTMTMIAGYHFVEAILERLAEINVGHFEVSTKQSNLPTWEIEEGSQLLIIPPKVSVGAGGDQSSTGTVQMDTRLGTFTCARNQYHLLEELLTEVLQRCSTVASVVTLYRNMLPAHWKGLLTTGGGCLKHTLGKFGLVEQYGALMGAGDGGGGGSGAQYIEISLKALALSGQPLLVWIQKIRHFLSFKLIKVQVISLETALQAAQAGADILLFKLGGEEDGLALPSLLAILERMPQLRAVAAASDQSATSSAPPPSKRQRLSSPSSSRPLLVEVAIAESVVVTSATLLALALPHVDVITVPAMLQMQLPDLHFYLRVV